MAPICFHPAYATETTFTQITFLALNPASVNHLLLLCLNSEWEWGVAHIHLLKVFYFLSLFQKVLPRWVFFSLLTRFLYFSTYPLYDPHLNFPLSVFLGQWCPSLAIVSYLQIQMTTHLDVLQPMEIQQVSNQFHQPPDLSAELPLPRGVGVLTCPHSLYVIKPQGLLILFTISEVH